MRQFRDLSATDFLEGGKDDEKPLVPDTDFRADLVLQTVKAHPDGVTSAEIVEALTRMGAPIATSTLLNVLRRLEHAREVYSRPARKGAPLIWYPNGRLVHPYLELLRDVRGKTYRVSVQSGRSGPAVQIQERSYSLVFGDRVDGAVFFEYDVLDQLIEMLKEIQTRYESYEKTKVGK